MPRVIDIMVVILYAMVALVAALAFDRFGLMSTQIAWMMGALVFLIAGQVHAAAARAQERAIYDEELHELKAANLSMLDELQAAQERLDVIETAVSKVPTPAEMATDPSIGAEDSLLTQLLTRLSQAEKVESATSSTAPRSDEAPLVQANAAEMVREALDANRVDLYLQPVVGLPQRRTYFYEGFTRIRDVSGEVIPPSAFLTAAEQAGLITDVDNLLLLRCVQIVRRLTKSDRRVGVFCNVSINSLGDEDFFPAFLDFLRRNSDLSGALIFELPRAAFENRSATAARNMARLADFGFRFSIDRVDDLDVDLAEMQRAGVRFMKVAGSRLVEAIHGGEPIAGREPRALRSEDIAALFARYGIDLIAEKIEAESTVVEVLDLDIAYAQGHLFGAPRPVRDEVMAETDRKVRRAG
jgi:cyclic-di-GMP phosphodiesterase TipF (flagellum assembly factor)